MFGFGWLKRMLRRRPKRFVGIVVLDARGSGPVQVLKELEDGPIIGSRCQKMDTHAPIIALSRKLTVIDEERGIVQFDGEYLADDLHLLCRRLEEIGFGLVSAEFEKGGAKDAYRTCDTITNPLLQFASPVTTQEGSWTGCAPFTQHLFIEKEMDGRIYTLIMNAFREADLLPASWPRDAIFQNMVIMYRKFHRFRQAA